MCQSALFITRCLRCFRSQACYQGDVINHVFCDEIHWDRFVLHYWQVCLTQSYAINALISMLTHIIFTVIRSLATNDRWWPSAFDAVYLQLEPHDDDDDEGRINFSMALSPKTTRTRNNKLKQWSHVIVVSAMRRFSHVCKTGQKVWFSVCCGKLATTAMTGLTTANCSRSMQQSLDRCSRQW